MVDEWRNGFFVSQFTPELNLRFYGFSLDVLLLA